MKRIEFANSLRGIAALCVVIAHYILMFNYIKGEFGGLPPLPDKPFPEWLTSLSSPIGTLNMGAFGVALFFLISGLVIPISIANLQGQPRAKTQFIIGRIFRIWPTYAAGLIVTLLSLEVAAGYMGYTTSYSTPQVLMQMSLFRDWFGSSFPLDGVVWTLEVEIKFYLATLLCWSMIGRGSLLPMAILGVATVIIANFSALLILPPATPGAYANCVKYVFFMMIGVAFNYHYRDLLSTEKLFAITFSMLCVFGYCCLMEGWQIEVIVSYFAAFALFSVLYLLAREWNGGPVFRFLANISYPLYACHGAFGIVGMRIMIEHGVGAILALAMQTAATILLSWGIHKLIENPTHILGKKLGRMCAVTRAAPALH